MQHILALESDTAEEMRAKSEGLHGIIGCSLPCASGVMRSASPRLVWIDLLRVLAGLSVVCLHVAASHLSAEGVSPIDWWTANLANGAVRWAVPAFVMISGMLILPRADGSSVLTFFRRRVLRMLLLTVCWTVIYLLYRSLQDGFDLRSMAESVLRGKPYFHLWFLYMLLGLYVAAPFVAIFLKNAGTNAVGMGIGLLLLLGASDSLLQSVGVGKPTAFTLWLPYLAYFVAGHLLPCGKLSMRSLGMILLLSVVATAMLTGITRPFIGNLATKVFSSNFSPFTIASAMAIFLLIRQSAGRMPEWVGRLVCILGPYTLGVYVIHPLWLDGLAYATGALRLPAVVSIPAYTVAAFLLSLLTSILLKAIPGLRRLVN